MDTERITIVESSFDTDSSYEIGNADSITFTNYTGIDYDMTHFILKLSKTDGLESVKHVTIDYYSKLSDCEFVNSFPNLETLFLYGQHITSLDGISSLSKLRMVEYLPKSKRHDISELSECKVSNLDIENYTNNDLEVIRNTDSIRELTLRKGVETSDIKFCNPNCQSISFVNSKSKTLNFSGTSIEDAWFCDCRKLEAIEGQNSMANNLVFEACKQFDYKSLRTFRNLKSVRVVSSSSPIDLLAFKGIYSLERLTIASAKVSAFDEFCEEYDNNSLRELCIFRLSDEELKKISCKLPDCIVTNVTLTYKNGKIVQSERYV